MTETCTLEESSEDVPGVILELVVFENLLLGEATEVELAVNPALLLAATSALLTTESWRALRADSMDAICVRYAKGIAVMYDGGGPRTTDWRTCVNGVVSLAAEAALTSAAARSGSCVAWRYCETICEIEKTI